MYIWTRILHLSEESFWNATPRKLFSLLDIHNEVNKSGEEEAKKQKEPEKLTMGDLALWR